MWRISSSTDAVAMSRVDTRLLSPTDIVALLTTVPIPCWASMLKFAENPLDYWRVIETNWENNLETEINIDWFAGD